MKWQLIVVRSMLFFVGNFSSVLNRKSVHTHKSFIPLYFALRKLLIELRFQNLTSLYTHVSVGWFFFIAILSFHYKSFCLHFTVCLYVRCWYLLYWAFGTSITLMHLFLILLLYYNSNVVNLQIANAQP